MLNRRILRIKAFKVLYAYAEHPALTLKEALSMLDVSCEATRDLYLYLLALVPALTAEADRRIEAARTKFNPSADELHPNRTFVTNRLAALLEADPDFNKLIEKKHLSWQQNDVFLHDLYERVKSRPYYASYMAAGEGTLAADVRLFQHIFEQELEDDPALQSILEDQSVFWADELGYALGAVLRSLDEVARTGRWDLPPLYQSDLLIRRGRPADSDRQFVQNLLTTAFGQYAAYSARVAGAVSGFEQDRLVTTDTVLIILGLAEAATFPEIPAGVSINEYVEIAKYYSTPKSHGFVNGLLDKLIREDMAAGRIVKTGRGLL